MLLGRRKRTVGGCAPSPSGSGEPSHDVFAGWLKMLWGFESGRPRGFGEKRQSPTIPYSLALRKSESPIVTLVGILFGRVIPRSNQELGVCSSDETFSDLDQWGQGGRPPNIRNFSNSIKPSQTSATSNQVVAEYSTGRPTGVPIRIRCQNPRAGGLPPAT